MKKIMEMLQNMKAKNEKKDNKGFSLVELIIVIAIMASLVGIVGTQVIPYINKSKEAKDEQILNSYSTAAVSAYSMLAGDLTTESGTITVKVWAANGGGADADSDEAKLAGKIQNLIGTGYTEAKSKMGSNEGKKATEITISINLTNHTIETVATGTTLNKIKADI